MDVDNIKNKYNRLNTELKKALSTMQSTDQVIIIRNEIKALQNICPHDNGTYNFSNTEECPYCGKKFKG